MFDEENLISLAIFLSFCPRTFTRIQLAMSQPITRKNLLLFLQKFCVFSHNFCFLGNICIIFFARFLHMIFVYDFTHLNLFGQWLFKNVKFVAICTIFLVLHIFCFITRFRNKYLYFCKFALFLKIIEVEPKEGGVVAPRGLE